MQNKKPIVDGKEFRRKWAFETQITNFFSAFVLFPFLTTCSIQRFCVISS